MSLWHDFPSGAPGPWREGGATAGSGTEFAVTSQHFPYFFIDLDGRVPPPTADIDKCEPRL